VAPRPLSAVFRPIPLSNPSEKTCEGRCAALVYAIALAPPPSLRNFFSSGAPRKIVCHSRKRARVDSPPSRDAMVTAPSRRSTRSTSSAVRDRRAAPVVASMAARHRVRLVQRLAPVNKRPHVVDCPRRFAAPRASEVVALEDRGSKLLARGADVNAPALFAIRDALRTAARRERPVPRAQPQDRAHAPPWFCIALCLSNRSFSRASCGSRSGS
jgi:hypothetical protein